MNIGIGLGSIAFRFALAVVLSAIVGCERSIKRHSAGLRTFLLMALASCAVVMIDGELAALGGRYLLSAAVLVASASISVYSLFRNARNQIQGLTTAVALWVCCIIGLACGAGLYALAVVSFLMLMISLSMLPELELWLKNRSNHFEVHLELTDARQLVPFLATIRRLGLTIDGIESNDSYRGSGLSVYSVSMTITSPELKKYKTHREIIEALSTLQYVSYIEEMR